MLLKTICCFFLSANFVIACETPDLQQGQCKPIQQCPVLYSLLDENLNNQTITYLKRSRCGGTNRRPNVCCPGSPPKFDSSNACQTPHNSQGKCQPIKECTFLFSLLDNLTNETRKYLKESRCTPSGDKTNPNVCCPNTAPTFEGPLTRKMGLLCQTAYGQNGTCRQRNKCLVSSHFGNKIPKSGQCGGSMVCCPFTSSIPLPHSNLLPKESECGESTESKIFGGNETDIDEFPWMVLLQYQSKSGNRSFGCGGALITKRYVLTARHCVVDSLISVRLGEWDTRTDPDCVVNKYGSDCAPKVLDVPIEKRIPYRDKTSFINDIALLRLSQEIQFGDFITPICLPTTPSELVMAYEGEKLFISGWGKTERKKHSDVKLKVLVPVVPFSRCKAVFGTGYPIDGERQICAGGEGGKDNCNGDSGGPLMYRGARWYIAGIVSYGTNNPCGLENRPSVYVKVSKYVGWIINNIKP